MTLFVFQVLKMRSAKGGRLGATSVDTTATTSTATTTITHYY